MQTSISLSLVTRPGIAIRVLDGELREIGQGNEQMEITLAQGLYLIEWSSAGWQAQSMVRLDGSQAKVEVRFDPSDPESGATLDTQASGRFALVDAVKGALRPSESNYDSSIVLVATGDPEILKQAGHLKLRLYDREEVAMRANLDDAPNIVLGAGERAHCYRVRPGRYHIGFQSILNERLGQSVPALAGRQTLVFLTVAKTTLISSGGDEFHSEDSVGVDPGKTIIVTVRGDEEDYRVRERMRLAGLMLFDLASGTNSLTPGVIEVLDDPKTDPLLRLYGSVVALTALKQSSVSSNVSSQSGLPSFSDQPWSRRLRDWIGNPVRPGLPTDAIAAAWEIQRLFPQTSDPVEWGKVPSRVEAPPMLDRAWRWAIESTVERPNTMRGSAVVAAARTGGGTLPWLCWQLSAAKARFVPATSSVGDLPALISRVAEQVSHLIGSDGIGQRLVSGLNSLSPDVQATALRAMQLVVPGAKEVSIGTVTDMAVSLGLPAGLLRKRLVNTSAALDSAASSLRVESANSHLVSSTKSSQDQAPALNRRIVHKDDLQKGRFGGKSASGGFSVSAKFEETSSKNWVKVICTVEGPGEGGEEVQFHRHDSFKPQILKEQFKAGTAKMSVTIWGGFTLGIWIPAHRVELELDLAVLSNAPRIVRER